MEVYIDDMLVQSLLHLHECFEILHKYQMKFNPTKCSLCVSFGKFIGYLMTHRWIEMNLDKLHALGETPPPRNRREVQRLACRMTALDRYISPSTDKCLPFYQLLKAYKKSEWKEKCEKTFKELKTYLATPPILTKPVEEEPLFLYIDVSHAVASGVLVREDRGD